MKISANGIQVNYTLEGPADGPMVTMSHSLATDLSMWDPQAEASRRPSGENAPTAQGRFGRSAIGIPVAASQTRTAPSLPQETSKRPSGENARLFTLAPPRLINSRSNGSP